MAITNFDTSAYIHLHFTLVKITKDYRVDVSEIQEKFDKLKNLDLMHRLLSFGGSSLACPLFGENCYSGHCFS